MPITTIEQFRQRILDNVVDDIDELPRGMEAAWFNDPVAHAPTIFKLNEIVPFDPYSRVTGIFHADGVMRIYSMPAAPPTPAPKDWPLRNPTRYTLTKTAPTYIAEILTLEAMADAIAEEWNAIAGDEDTAADELEAVLEYVTGLDKTIDRDTLLTALREGIHRDEPEPGPAPVVVPTPAPVQPS